jgi:adenylate kinase family enzyme
MQPKEETRRGAVLLMGPTGSGKTPLGQLMESRGLWGFPCLHFDFGHELRNSVVSPGTFLSGDEREFVTHVLNAGALLDDEHFPLALKIFEGFINSHNPDRRTIIVLNGMPRHTGQAERMQELVRMLAVVSLECPPETVVRRIRLDTGGDRAGRIDDSIGEVQRKLELFKRRTAPLLEYYRAKHVGIISFEAGPDTTSAEMLEKIQYSAGAD